MAGSEKWREVRNGGKAGSAKWREERYDGKPHAIVPAILFFFKFNALRPTPTTSSPTPVASRRTDGRTDGRTASCIGIPLVFGFGGAIVQERKKCRRVRRPSVGVGRIQKISNYVPATSCPPWEFLSTTPISEKGGRIVSYQNSKFELFPHGSFFHFAFLLFVSLFQYIEFPHLNTDTYVGLSAPCFLLRRLESICFLVFIRLFLWLLPRDRLPPAALPSFLLDTMAGQTTIPHLST